MNEKLPRIALKHSIKIEVKQGETYFYCSCGLSKTQPFCDGSHKGSGLSPIKFIAENDKLVGFCGCKHSKIPPFCDGAHKTIA